MKSFNALSIGATGKTQAFTGTSAGSTIPTGADALNPNYCVISATAACHVRWGKGAQTAVTTDLYIAANTPPVPINTAGSTHFAVIQDSAGGNLYITPLEWVR